PVTNSDPTGLSLYDPDTGAEGGNVQAIEKRETDIRSAPNYHDPVPISDPLPYCGPGTHLSGSTCVSDTPPKPEPKPKPKSSTKSKIGSAISCALDPGSCVTKIVANNWTSRYNPVRIAVNFAAVPPYAMYAGAWWLRKNGGDKTPFNFELEVIEADGLGTDIMLDYAKNRVFHNGESIADEGMRGSYLPNPLPQNLIVGYLPGLSEDHGHYKLDF
ncbi:hypothetical protein ACFZB9_25775, partial [Kitasatospora sp. NPDC008050]|uniref:hypothetical protein n=1 Tax=Kitasatospora sp. NPDC008050 TaxID=3364021 RepID=UPI0036EBF559